MHHVHPGDEHLQVDDDDHIDHGVQQLEEQLWVAYDDYDEEVPWNDEKKYLVDDLESLVS